MTTLMEFSSKIAVLVMTAALATGCASGPDHVEDDFGNSVQAMKRAQTGDPLTLISTDTTPVETTDGRRMENALNTYRSDTSTANKVRKPIEISVGD